MPASDPTTPLPDERKEMYRRAIRMSGETDTITVEVPDLCSLLDELATAVTAKNEAAERVRELEAAIGRYMRNDITYNEALHAGGERQFFRGIFYAALQEKK